MKVQIPEMLRRHIFIKITKRLIAFAFLAIALTASLLLRPGFIGEFSKTNTLLFAVIGSVLTVLISGVPHKLLDFTWQGIVRNIHIMTTTDTETPGKGGRGNLYTQNVVILTIQTPQGRIRKHVAEKLRIKDGQKLLEKYAEGDFVAHITQTRYLAHFKEKNAFVRCVICGSETKPEQKYCALCGMELVTRE